MIRLVFGYTTEDRESDPTVLYAGHDASLAERAIALAPASFIRLEFGDNPHVRPVNRPNPPADTVLIVAPSAAEAQAMMARIKELEGSLDGCRLTYEGNVREIQEEFKRQIEVGVSEIESLRQQLANVVAIKRDQKEIIAKMQEEIDRLNKALTSRSDTQNSNPPHADAGEVSASSAAATATPTVGSVEQSPAAGEPSPAAAIGDGPQLAGPVVAASSSSAPDKAAKGKRG